MKMPGSVELTLIALLEAERERNVKEWKGKTVEEQARLYAERMFYILEALKWVRDASRE